MADIYGDKVALEEQAAALPGPGAAGPLARPSEQPDVPITDGLALGAGRGPEAVTGSALSPLDYLRAAYRRHPTEQLRRVIESQERGL